MGGGPSGKHLLRPLSAGGRRRASRGQGPCLRGRGPGRGRLTPPGGTVSRSGSPDGVPGHRRQHLLGTCQTWPPRPRPHLLNQNLCRCGPQSRFHGPPTPVDSDARGRVRASYGRKGPPKPPGRLQIADSDACTVRRPQAKMKVSAGRVLLRAASRGCRLPAFLVATSPVLTRPLLSACVSHRTLVTGFRATPIIQVISP